MKKSLSFLGILILLFLSCVNNNWEDSIITNNSEYQVTFKFNNTEKIQLEAGESAEFPTTAHQRIKSYSPDKRVYFTFESTNTGYTGQFLTRESYTVKINNAIGENAILSANDWMDEMIIPPGNDDDSNHTGKIYTSTPFFSVKTESGFPAVVIFNKAEIELETETEEETETDTKAETEIIFFVTIR